MLPWRAGSRVGRRGGIGEWNAYDGWSRKGARRDRWKMVERGGTGLVYGFFW